MKIISDFHDYYDGCMAYGTDPSLRYIRMQRELSAAESKTFPEPRGGPWGDTWEARGGGTVHGCSCWLVVAGLTYRGYRFRYAPNHYGSGEIEEFAYDLDSLHRIAKTLGIQVRSEKVCRRRRSCGRPAREAWVASQGTNEMREEYAKRGITTAGRWSGYLHRDPQPLILNPRLADFKFGKIMDAFRVYQELSMWIGGVLPRSGAMTASVSDADRYVEHGFDVRTSFRHPVK